MRRKINEENGRTKRKYAIWKREARRSHSTTVDRALEAINKFEASTGHKAFKAFKFEQAVAFKRVLEDALLPRTGKPLAKATIDGTLRAVKAFFDWLADQPGYRSRISRRDLEYFNLNAKDARVAHAEREVPFPTMEQCKHSFLMMPEANVFDRRDKAIFAFLMLTAARDGAVASLRLKHIDLVDSCVHQDAREVKTKASKTFSTWFYPVDAEYLQQLTSWVEHLRTERLFGPADALFPKPLMGLVDGKFAPVGLSREAYGSAAKICEVVARAFENAALPKFFPHSFRKTLVALGIKRCKTPEEFKAWSLNLGHDSVVTTMSAYCPVPRSRQRELMKGLQ